MKIALLKNEITLIIFILAAVAIFGTIDIFQEAGLLGTTAITYETNPMDVVLHVLKDALVTILSIVTSVWLIFKLNKTERINSIQAQTLKDKTSQIDSLNSDLQSWKHSSEKWRRGLLVEIENQMTTWSLSPAEKEIAFLLLKGLSYKEIGEVRHTSESTIRVQAQKIYEKSKLSSRSELAAFFLEDLFIVEPSPLI